MAAMADFQRFAGLRYDPDVAGDAAGLVAPPYDVVSAVERTDLYARSAYNIARVDYGEERPGDSDAVNRYTRARADLEAWRDRGVLRRDATPRLYVYDQTFSLDGETRVRRSVFGRLRLEEWARGIVLPHEHTGAAAKADRLRLLEATRVHLSPIMALYRGQGGAALLPDGALGAPLLDASPPGGQRHSLRPVADDAARALCRFLADQRLYVADGHHRYETALNYRNACRVSAASWTGEEPENFVLAALVDIADPGLVVLPTHRLVRLPGPADLGALGRLFEIEAIGAADEAGLVRLLAALAAAPGAFVAVGLAPGRLDLLRRKDAAAIAALVPSGHPEAWRRLDVAVLHHAVLPLLGYEPSPERVAFADDARFILAEVAAGRWDAGLLLSGTPIEEVLAVADAGERMPEKSTYFYPKLATGVVLYPLD